VTVAYIEHLGVTGYGDALREMTELAAARTQGAIPDTVMLLEHEPVITLGSRAVREGELRLPDDQYAVRGIEIVEVSRGGRSTYHGPGQLVAYPVVDLTPRGRDLRAYVRTLENVLVDTLAELGIDGHPQREPHAAGVWVEDRKIASIGVRCARWVTSHGFSLNVCNDLGVYELFDACGLGDARFTSVSAETGEPVTVDHVREVAVRHLAAGFGFEFTELPGAVV
jgi:lipoyl(octanoyl) transferase